MTKLVLDLDAKKIGSIKSYFDSNENVDIHEFIRIMRAHLDVYVVDHEPRRRESTHNSGEENQVHRSSSITSLNQHEDRAAQSPAAHGLQITEEQLISSLIELFREIDANGDGTMEWHELSKYICGKAFMSQDANSKTKTVQDFYPLPSVFGNKHNNFIDKVYNIPSTDQIAVLEQKSPAIRIYDSKNLHVMGVLSGVEGLPVAVECIPESGLLVTSCYNSRMYLWNLNPGPHQYKLAIAEDKIHKAIWPTPHVQTALQWNGYHRRLFSGSTSGLLHIWNPYTRQEISFTSGHNDVVSDLAALESLDCFASCSMDGVVSLWDMYSLTKRQEYKGHRKGVLGLAHCTDLNLIVSAGFDREAYIWSPFVGGLISKLSGHSAPLVGVEAMPNTTQVLTADADGIFKLWDLRNYRCLQTFTRERTKGITSFAYIPKRDRIVCGLKSLRFFEQGQDKNISTVSDLKPCICLLYNSTTLSIATAHGRDVKLWSALTGKLIVVFKSLTSSDISAMCLDDRERKLIIGENCGKIGVYNYLNGALMKEFSPHDGEVVSILYLSHSKCILTAGWDRYVVLHDETDPDKGSVIRVMDTEWAHQDDISTMAVSSVFHTVATGSSDCTVRVWDYDAGKVTSILQHSHQVCSVAFVDEVRCVLSSDTAGFVKLWGTRNSAWADHCLLSLRHIYNAALASPAGRRKTLQHIAPVTDSTRPETHKDSDGDGENLTSASSLVWIPGELCLITADERGHIRCWDWSSVISKLARQCIFVEKHVKPPKLTEEMVSLRWRVEAHDDSIMCLKYVSNPPSLISAGFDRTVHIWDMNGHRIGNLVQGVNLEVWNFPVDVSILQSEDARCREEALSLLHSSEKCEFNGDDDEGEGEKLKLPPMKRMWISEESRDLSNIDDFKTKALVKVRQKRIKTTSTKPVNRPSNVYDESLDTDMDPLLQRFGKLLSKKLLSKKLPTTTVKTSHAT
jgi:WD40 repeat protein